MTNLPGHRLLLPGVDHLNIEKTDKLNQMAIAAVLRTLGREALGNGLRAKGYFRLGYF